MVRDAALPALKMKAGAQAGRQAAPKAGKDKKWGSPGPPERTAALLTPRSEPRETRVVLLTYKL